MARGKRLKKVVGDLESQKQSAPSSKLRIGEQNVPFELGLDESSNEFSLELENDEITFNIDWKFQSRSGGLNCLKIYIH